MARNTTGAGGLQDLNVLRTKHNLGHSLELTHPRAQPTTRLIEASFDLAESIPSLATSRVAEPCEAAEVATVFESLVCARLL